MSHDIVKHVKATGTGRLTIISRSNNVTPAHYEECEYLSLSEERFSDKIREFFKAALNGNFELLSSCGRFYKIYKVVEDLNDKIDRYTKMNALEFDFRYMTDFYDLKIDWLSRYATDLYFNEQPSNFELFLEIFANDLKNAKERITKQMEEGDIVSIHSASYAEIFGRDADNQILYDVLADYEDNLYVCKREDYNNKGILSNASKAVRIKREPQLGILYGVLAGNYADKTRAEVLDWYKDRPVQRAAINAQMDAVQELLNGTDLPAYAKLPWIDFEEVVA